MLPRQHRLPLRQERNNLDLQGTKTNSPDLTLIVNPRSTPTDVTRFAVIVSKKLLPRAVDRNLLRRRILSVIHQRIPHILPSRDVLLIPRKHLFTSTPAQLETSLVASFTQASLLKKNAPETL